MVRNNPKALGILQQNCMEHINLMSNEQVQMEFAEEIAKTTALQQQMQVMMQQMGPQAQQNPQFMQMQKDIQQLGVIMESRKAVLIAEFTEDYAKAEKEVLNQIENDPLLKLKDREIDLKAREEARKKEEAEDKLNMEKMKLMQNRNISEDRLEQDDEHAKLRASVSLAKSGIQKMKATVVEGQ